jgi:hypothetical protein
MLYNIFITEIYKPVILIKIYCPYKKSPHPYGQGDLLIVDY